LNFGGPANKKGYNGNELQSKEFNDGSGLELYDFNARTYDQQIGRFIQIDPQFEDGQESINPFHFSYNNPIRYSDPDGRSATDIRIRGENNSSVTIKTDLIDIDVNASSLGADFRGNYTLSGRDFLITALDIVGVADPTPTSDLLSAKLSFESNDFWGGAASLIGAGFPLIGDAAKIPKIAKGLDKISDAIDAVKAVNGNSKASSKTQHVYEIFRTGKNGTEEVVKTGISGGKVSKKAGESYRATSQANKWNKAEGAGTYKTRIIENIPTGKGAREKAMQAEKTNAKKLQKEGHLLDRTKHITPR
jgi:RHS repeat-associated protein